MLLGLQDRFVPLVETGAKRHSIRAGERWRAGMRADLYARPRQKGMRLIFRAPVTQVDRIRITVLPLNWIERYTPSLRVSINGQPLDPGEIELLARCDGFPEGADEMAGYWRRTHGGGVFHGQIIHWDFEAREVH